MNVVASPIQLSQFHSERMRALFLCCIPQLAALTCPHQFLIVSAAATLIHANSSNTWILAGVQTHFVNFAFPSLSHFPTAVRAVLHKRNSDFLSGALLSPVDSSKSGRYILS